MTIKVTSRVLTSYMYFFNLILWPVVFLPKVPKFGTRPRHDWDKSSEQFSWTLDNKCGLESLNKVNVDDGQTKGDHNSSPWAKIKHNHSIFQEKLLTFASAGEKPIISVKSCNKHYLLFKTAYTVFESI